MPDLANLRRLDPPDVDVDAMLTRVQDRVRRRRRTRRAAAAIAAAAAVFVLSEIALTDGDDTFVDTAGEGGPFADPAGGVPVPASPHLPDYAPDGFELRWVDVYGGEPVDVWSRAAPAQFALGYQSPDGEYVIRVFPGARLDVDAVHRAWNRTFVADNTPGREVVTEDELQTLVAVDGAVIHIVSTTMSGPGRIDLEDQVAVARSLRPVPADDWTQRVQRVDFAPPFGVRRETTLVDGDGWKLIEFFARGVGMAADHSYAVRFDDEALPPSAGGNTLTTTWDRRDVDGTVLLQLLEHDGRAIAWGAASPGTTSVDLWFRDGTVTTQAISFRHGEAFAVELPAGTTWPPLMVVAFRADGTETARVDGSDRTCAQPDGAGEQVIVPNVTGLNLRDAVTAVHAAGLGTVGLGLTDGDPATTDAVVTAQAPPPGEQVVTGACVGFRTR